MMAGGDAMLQIAQKLYNDGVQNNFKKKFDVAFGLIVFESFQGFFCLSLCTTDDDPRDVH